MGSGGVDVAAVDAEGWGVEGAVGGGDRSGRVRVVHRATDGGPRQDAAGHEGESGDEHRELEAVGEVGRVPEVRVADAGQRRQYRDRDEAGGASHVVVDRGCNARVPRGCGAEDGRGQRCDGQREPAAEHDHTEQHVGPVVARRPDPHHQEESQAGDDRAEAHRDARPDARREPARAGGAEEHDEGDREQRRARRDRREPDDGLELDRQQEERTRERGVDDERHEVRGGELRRLEDSEGHERMRRPGFHADERAEQDDARQHRDQCGRGGPARFGPARQPADQPGQPQHREDRARDVDPALRLFVLRLRHVPQADEQDHRRERQVDQEDPAPRRGLDEPPTEERSDRGHDPAETGPRADRRGTVLGHEARLEDRQASRGEQCGAHALQRPGHDERFGVRCDRAQHRSAGEPNHPEQEDAPAAEEVTERATEQQEAGEGQGVCVHDPLQAREAGVEVLADRRQRDVDDRGVERGEARAEHGGE